FKCYLPQDPLPEIGENHIFSPKIEADCHNLSCNFHVRFFLLKFYAAT
ncbi:MAG: hypothetical protein ACI9YL_001388, partial [Luteibaculaceae bacterium]